MIAAMDGQGAIGKDGTMAWYVPQELHHFKKLTMDGVLIMGRVTYESIGRTLPGRVSIIVSRGANPGHEAAPNMHWVTSLCEALSLASCVYTGKKIWIAGGASVYEQMMPKSSFLSISRLPFTIDHPDAFFPEIDPVQWLLIKEEDFFDMANVLLFTSSTYKRVFEKDL